MAKIRVTEGIVLRKTDYSESSVIVSIFTYEYGLTSFMVRGDRKLTKKHSPQFDVLRVLSLSFEMKPQ
jgi:DNA repair protein RecO (recombination protein O)